VSVEALHTFVSGLQWKSSYNERSFWNSLILQACYSYEAVRHALVAIGSFHEGLGNADNERRIELYRYAYEQYSKAITVLTRASGILTTEEVLMACVLFT